MNSDWDDLYMKIDCLDETKTIPLKYSFIWGHIEDVIGRKALRILDFVTRSTASATEMRSNVDSLNIKVIPLGDMKFSHVENPFILYLAKIRCQHMPPCFSANLARRKIICIVFVLRPSAIYFSQGDNYVSAMFVLRAIIVYWPLPT